MPLKQIAAQAECRFNRDFAQNGDRKCDEETSEGVPCSFRAHAYSSLIVRGHLAVKIVASRMLDS